MDYEKALDVEYVLKDILTPYIWLLIQDTNNYLRKHNFPFLLVIGGGDALSKFFPEDPKLLSHDFDARLAPIVGSEKLPNILELQHKLAAKIIKYFEVELNKIIVQIAQKLRQKLKITFPVSLKYIKIQKGGIFEADRGIKIGGKCTQVPVGQASVDYHCDLYTLTYTLKVNESIVTDSMFDLFCSRPDNLYHYYVNINEYNINRPKIFIPYMIIEGVPYASLGYIIWDTLRIIDWSREHGYYKLPRYQMKLEQMIRGLYHPNGRLSCTAMREFVKGCVRANRRDCNVQGIEFDRNGLVDYAVLQGLIPRELSQKFKTEFSKEYLCKYINELQENLPEAMQT